MSTKLPRVDAVLVGFGWTASMMAQELVEAGLNVLALERGGFRDTIPDFAPTQTQDELRYAVRKGTFEEPERETLTFRNALNETALPMRQLGSFLPGVGVGGAGVHWNGQNFRYLPSDFRIRSHNEQRYGKKFLPDDMTVQDWPMSYEDLEPYYDKWERLCGISGKAGNLNGTLQAGGNPFEGARKNEFPNPPLKTSAAGALFAGAASSLGLHPYPCPAANASQPYTNFLGAKLGQCTYCGFCEWFGCGNYSKASPQTTILPVLLRNPSFQYRTGTNVTRVNLDSTGKRATGVTYVDAQGREFEQPADLVVLCAYALHNVHLLLLSKIGTPYDPQSGKGVIGRNYAYQVSAYVDTFFKDIVNPFMGAGALGQVVDDYNGDNFDHGPHGFIGGGYICMWSTGGRPILQHYLPEGTPTWGAQWKRAMHENYLRASSMQIHGSIMSYKQNYLDLDPTYRDIYGNPLLRLTFDFHKNELDMAKFTTDRAVEIAKAIPGSRGYHVHERAGHYNIVDYQTTHNTGGAILGDSPETSAVNRYLQSWDVHNVFVMGSSAYPQNVGYNPTGTVGALTYWAADAIRNTYLKNPGPLA
jgi:gluconate 2-dehydrogenase alpha chain